MALLDKDEQWNDFNKYDYTLLPEHKSKFINFTANRTIHKGSIKDILKNMVTCKEEKEFIKND